MHLAWYLADLAKSLSILRVAKDLRDLLYFSGTAIQTFRIWRKCFARFFKHFESGANVLLGFLDYMNVQKESSRYFAQSLLETDISFDSRSIA